MNRIIVSQSDAVRPAHDILRVFDSGAGLKA